MTVISLVVYFLDISRSLVRKERKCITGLCFHIFWLAASTGSNLPTSSQLYGVDISIYILLKDLSFTSAAIVTPIRKYVFSTWAPRNYIFSSIATLITLRPQVGMYQNTVIDVLHDADDFPNSFKSCIIIIYKCGSVGNQIYCFDYDHFNLCMYKDLHSLFLPYFINFSCTRFLYILLIIFNAGNRPHRSTLPAGFWTPFSESLSIPELHLFYISTTP